MSNINKVYAPAEAERGKFLDVTDDMISTLGYTPTGRGKYAVLTYNTNPNIINLSGTTIAITEPLTVETSIPGRFDVDNIASVDLVDDVTTVGTINTVNSVTVISALDTINSVVSTSEVLTNQVVVSSITLSNNVSTIDFSSLNVKELEVYNNDINETAYLLYTNSTTLDSISSIGLPLVPEAYYSISKEVDYVSIGSLGNSVNIRVFGHYRG